MRARVLKCIERSIRSGKKNMGQKLLACRLTLWSVPWRIHLLIRNTPYNSLGNSIGIAEISLSRDVRPSTT